MKFVVIGNGPAGFAASRRLRELDQDCEIVVLTAEPYHYYYRPRLPEVVAGEIDVDQIVMNPPDWYESRRIDVRLSARVASIDTESKVISLDGGARVEYDRLLIASGSHPFVPPVDGVDKKGVFTLRTAEDALAIRDWAGESSKAVVVGGGLLGLETAKGLSEAGLPVTVLEHSQWLLSRQLDEVAARIMESEIEKLGITVVKEATSVAVAGEDRAEGVILDDGRTIEGDLVLFSTGVRAAVDFLEGSGIEVNRGIVVDCGMRTNVADVFAAGDVAEFEGRSWGIIPVALAQADVAARWMTGNEETEYCAIVPSNTLKITGIDVFSAGEFTCKDDGCREIVDADEGSGRYRKVVLRDGKIAGAIVVGSKVGAREIGSLIEKGASVERWGDDIVRESFDYKAALSSVE